jgi:hypothetical protein
MRVEEAILIGLQRIEEVIEAARIEKDRLAKIADQLAMRGQAEAIDAARIENERPAKIAAEEMREIEEKKRRRSAAAKEGWRKRKIEQERIRLEKFFTNRSRKENRRGMTMSEFLAVESLVTGYRSDRKIWPKLATSERARKKRVFKNTREWKDYLIPKMLEHRFGHPFDSP